MTRTGPLVLVTVLGATGTGCIGKILDAVAPLESSGSASSSPGQATSSSASSSNSGGSSSGGASSATDNEGLNRISGEGQRGRVGTELAAPFVIAVLDSGHNPVNGLSVNFIVTGGGGSLSEGSVRTDAFGRAQTNYTLGLTAGLNTVEAQAGGVAGSPLVFTATALAGPATKLGVTSGDGQSGTAGSPLTSPFIVTARDSNDNAVAGVTVDFVVTSGGGALSVPSILTNAQGQAQSTLTLGTRAGANTVSVEATGLVGSPVAFTATGLSGQATKMALTSGNGQSGPGGSPLGAPFVVTAMDVNDNAVTGVLVNFAVTAGGGTLSGLSATTDSQGRAETTLTLGTASGTSMVEAQAMGLSGSPVVFTATRPATTLVATSGTGQSGTAGSALPQPLIVTALDANDNPVAGVTVDFMVTAGGGGISLPSVTTDGQGRAQVTLTLGTTTGANTLEAQVTGLSGMPVVFTATGLPGPATNLVLVSGDAQGGQSLARLPQPFVVAVRDSNANGVPGIAVDFVVTGGGGTVSAASPMTDAQGHAETDLTLGAMSGTTTVEARATTLAGSPLMFTTTAIGLVYGQFPTGVRPFSIAMGDLNGDGKLDLVVKNTEPSTVSILLNTAATAAAAPSFAATVNFNASISTGQIVIGDLNGDGKRDVAFGRNVNLSILMNMTPMGATMPTFATESDVAVGGTNLDTRGLAIGDLNGDGVLDLAFKVPTTGMASVLLNTTTTGAMVPSFAAKADFQAGVGEGSAAIGDLNGDGKMDLVVSGEGNLAVFLNTAASAATLAMFAPKVDLDFGLGSGESFVAIGDLNGDGKPDLAVASRERSVSVFLSTTALGAAAASFLPRADITAGRYCRSIAIGDLNGDGKPELAVARSNYGLMIFPNTTAMGAPAPSFATAISERTLLTCVAIGDLNGDGKLDLATAHYVSSDTAGVFLTH